MLSPRAHGQGLGVDFGWCEPDALADAPIEPLQKEVTFGNRQENRRLRVHFAYTVPSGTENVSR